MDFSFFCALDLRLGFADKERLVGILDDIFVVIIIFLSTRSIVVDL